jgi:hypothetical protein
MLCPYETKAFNNCGEDIGAIKTGTLAISKLSPSTRAGHSMLCPYGFVGDFQWMRGQQ